MAVGSLRAEEPTMLDLTHAVVVTPKDQSPRQKLAVKMLVEEVEKRTGNRWKTQQEMPSERRAVVAIGSAAQLLSLNPEWGNRLDRAARVNWKPEAFSLDAFLEDGRQIVLVEGFDERGVLFGVGQLLRSMEMRKDTTILQSGRIESAPAIPLRGHQLGYRPKTNSYDGWDLKQWEQYIRDLAVFGTNAIELIPPRSDDDADSPNFPLAPMPTMIGMSKIADDYGLDVWIWYPAMDEDYSKPETVEYAIKEWGEVYRQLPRIDAVFVPSGDPGDAQPRHLIPLLEKQTANLRKYHPKAQMWVSVQGYTQPEWDEMMAILAKEPDWLAGIVFGPQTRVTIEELRGILPKRYAIRRYPDITHSLRCEFPVPAWDKAFAFTEAREVINPRPIDQSIIFRAHKEGSIGFITYSEGCNDDVNKMIWSGLGWNPGADVVDILRDYSRYFVGTDYADDFAQGLLALEQNWRGPLLTNKNVMTTLKQFQGMEKRASKETLANWRFQQALYRAYYDAYIHRRLVHETAIEERAMDVLRSAPALGSAKAIEQARAILAEAKEKPVAQDLRQRVFDLADDLYESIRMQLSVKKHKAIEAWRGANLDTIDVPLNNHNWLMSQFDKIGKEADETKRLSAIQGIVHWTDPGPGGFYDDLGDPARQPHYVDDAPYEKDPGFLQSPDLAFHYVPLWRQSWCTHADGHYQTPVKMQYAGLDPSARYKIRVVYAGDDDEAPVRLVAGGGIEIHPLIAKPQPVKPIEFEIPRAATSAGVLELTWTSNPERGGPGRGVQIAEVWLMKVR